MSRILIVEDEREICGCLEIFFKDEGFEVSSVFTAKEGLKKIRSFNPDVVLLDVKLPDMDSIEFLRKIRNQKSKIRVVLITADETDERISQARTLGVEDILSKPFRLDHLEQVVLGKVPALLN